MANPLVGLRQNTLDFLSNTGYRLFIHRLPQTSFTVQRIVIPDVSLPAVMESTPFVQVPKPGDHLQYASLSVQFIVDEQLVNYQEIYNWITGLGFPRSFWEYEGVAKEPGTGVTSDIVVYILDAKRNPKFQFNFLAAVPVSLGGLTFDSTVTGMSYLTATATFAYESYTISPLTS